MSDWFPMSVDSVCRLRSAIIDVFGLDVLTS